MGGKDIMEKTLEAYNDVFADIVNGLLFEGRPVVTPDSLEDAQPVSFYKAEGNLHEQERDVSKYWKKCRIRIALLGFENQTKYDPFMPFRVIGYDGAAYRAQIGGDNPYPVITIILYFGSDRRWGKNKSLYDLIDVPEELKPYVNDYRINVFDIAFLTDEEIARFHSDFGIVADFFAHRRVDPDYRPANPRDFEHIDEVLKLLSVIADDDRYVSMMTSEGGKPKNMDQYLNRVEERGITKGTLQKAKEDALAIRKMLKITDPVLVSQIVNVEAELVERWFEEEKV